MNDKVYKILADFGETDRSNVWQVQNATVIKHACLERVAAKAGIIFDAPTILRAERDEAVILVTGTCEQRSEWSIGEALVGANYRVTGKMAAYVYAMAEKRAKDRVILKLINLHGLAYSEDEADNFAQRAEPEKSTSSQRLAEDDPFSESTEGAGASRLVAEYQDRIRAIANPDALVEWWNGPERKKATQDFGLSQAEMDVLKGAVIARKAELDGKVRAA